MKKSSKPPFRRLPPLLRRAWYALNQTFRRRIAHLEITPDQFTILRWLQESDPRGLTQNDLTALMASDPNTITSILRRMERAGLLERRPHESDRRANRVRLRPLGWRKFAAAQQVALHLQGKVLAVLPAKRRELFLRDLECVACACQRALEATEREASADRSRTIPPPRS